MRSKPLIIGVTLVIALAAAGGGVYAYDRAHAAEIAPGIKVGGIAVGGMTPAAARARLQREILDPLSRPIVVHRGQKRWALSAREARIRADLSAMVDEAVARSRHGDIVGRTWRGLRGARVDADLEPGVLYSDRAVIRLLDRVRAAVKVAPKDAKVSLSGAGVARKPSRMGRELRATRLHEQIKDAIISPSATRSFAAHTRKVRSKVTTAQLADRYGTVLIVQRGAFRLQLYKRLKLSTTYPIAVGQVGLETPAGQYSIANKAVDPAWHVPDSEWAGDLAGKVIAGDDPSNPIKARWLGIYDGVGIHGTSDDASIGSNASHGCIRMHVSDVEKLYDQVPVGTAVYIA
ncbi:MAG: L,D-transpeptidase/peptidoglycan binding protein [Actinomycetota bacterium]|nr:L,D-transpeptidase/peptidoglycan binding protein [Actinomycetota bacterium]